MDISWLGHACVRLRTQRAAIVMDPVDRESGFSMGRPTADIVTVSNPNPAHSNVRGVRGSPLVLDGPGEYEVRGVMLMGIETSLTASENGVAPERNTSFVVESEDIRVAHLGGLGAPLTDEQAGELAEVDVLIIPVGGEQAIDADAAARILRQLDPAVVIPLHYNDQQPEALKRFVQAVGVEPEEPEQRVSFQRRGLRGEKVRLVLLQPRAG